MRTAPARSPSSIRMTALWSSAGAALETLLIAARRFGHRAAVDVTPDPLAEDPLARISLEPAARVSTGDEELFRAIPNGHTGRQPFEDRDLPDELTERLLADTHEDAVWLHLASGADRIAITELIAEGDRT